MERSKGRTATDDPTTRNTNMPRNHPPNRATSDPDNTTCQVGNAYATLHRKKSSSAHGSPLSRWKPRSACGDGCGPHTACNGPHTHSAHPQRNPYALAANTAPRAETKKSKIKQSDSCRPRAHTKPRSIRPLQISTIQPEENTTAAAPHPCRGTAPSTDRAALPRTNPLRTLNPATGRKMNHRDCI